MDFGSVSILVFERDHVVLSSEIVCGKSNTFVCDRNISSTLLTVARCVAWEFCIGNCYRFGGEVVDQEGGELALEVVSNVHGILGDGWVEVSAIKIQSLNIYPFGSGRSSSLKRELIIGILVIINAVDIVVGSIDVIELGAADLIRYSKESSVRGHDAVLIVVDQGIVNKAKVIGGFLKVQCGCPLDDNL